MINKQFKAFIFFYLSVPFLSNDYDYYYEDADFNDIDKKAKVPESLVKTVPAVPTTTPPPTSRWSINKESFTEADAKLPPMTTWKPLTFSKNMESFMGPSTTSESFSKDLV